MTANQKGFTLIELVVVIVVLGILASTALPKVVDLSSDARKVIIKSLAGTMASSNTMVHGKARATGLSGSTSIPANLSINGNTVAIAYGFAATAFSLSQAIDLYPPSDFVVTNSEIMLAKAPAPAKCVVRYTPAGFDTTGGFKTPTYVIEDSGC